MDEITSVQITCKLLCGENYFNPIWIDKLTEYVINQCIKRCKLAEIISLLAQKNKIFYERTVLLLYILSYDFFRTFVPLRMQGEYLERKIFTHNEWLKKQSYFLICSLKIRPLTWRAFPELTCRHARINLADTHNLSVLWDNMVLSCHWFILTGLSILDLSLICTSSVLPSVCF